MSNKFPTAFEMQYRFLLINIREKIEASQLPFIDITLENKDVISYLEGLGYLVQPLRYEYKDGVYGFYGRRDGDGDTLRRILWEHSPQYRNMWGDYRV